VRVGIFETSELPSMTLWEARRKLRKYPPSPVTQASHGDAHFVVDRSAFDCVVVIQP
jgi:hypothetical protein